MTQDLDYAGVVAKVMAAAQPYKGKGKVADYIPGLAKVDPDQFGFALATVGGEVHADGDCDVEFALESISKVFSLALVLSHDDQAIWKRTNREPSGNPFNSLFQLEFENGIPRNPLINPGAIVVTDQLLHDTGDALEAVRGLMRSETGNPDLHVDSVIANSETETGDRNRALAYLMADFGNMINPVDRALDHYFRQCSLMVTAQELALAGLVFARHGERADGSRLISREDARRIVSLMETCGTYDAAGEFAYRIGLPCKSGVGGAILAVIPGKGSAVAWGPGLDPAGNSVSGGAAMESFSELTGWSIF